MTELSDHFTIKQNDADHEVFMSFGLLRHLSATFPGANDPAEVFRDQTQFDLALWLLLVPRSKTGKLEVEEFDLNDCAIAAKDSIALVKWAMEHLIRFLLQRLSLLPKLGEESLTEMEALLSAFPGLKDSLSTSPFAGPTAGSEAVSASTTKKSPTPT